jgi:hypothetical protein
MMTEFLSQDPGKALIEVKEKLYERIDILRSCIHPDGPIDRLDHHFNNEVEFLTDVLDLIERS